MSRAKEPNLWRAKQIAAKLGFTEEQRQGERLSFSEQVERQVLRTVKGRTHFISCTYYCTLAIQYDVSQDETNRTLTEFFNGRPSMSLEYNHTVSAGSAKPTSVQTRRDVMRSLLPVTDKVEESGLE